MNERKGREMTPIIDKIKEMVAPMMVKPNGQEIIDNAVNMFTSVVQKLEEGLDLCLNKKNENDAQIQDLISSNSKLDGSIEKGKRVIKKINEIIE